VRRPGGSGARRRSLVLAVASVALLIGALAPAHAQEAPAPFTNGTASATAIVTRLTPGVGSLPTGLFGGVALTNVTNAIAQAQAETLDLGLIGALLAALDVVPASDLPSPIRVDNRGGDASAAEDEYPLSGSTLGGGRKEVAATTVPSASATSTLATAYGDVVRLEGARAESVSEVIPGRAREGRAAVTVDVDIAGLVQLSGLRWDAVHRTGEGARADATFGLREARVGGVPLPLDDLATVEGTVNAALATTGISVQLPKVERFTEPVDVVRVTSLRVMLRDTPLGRSVLGPVLNATRAERERLVQQLSDAYGPAAAALLAADVATSIASGSGFLSVEVGGAEATSSPLVLRSPFGEAGAAPGTALGPAPLSVPPLPVTGAPGSAVGPTGAHGASIGPVEDRCRSVHVLRPLACSDGSLVPIGLAGLGAAAVVGGLDLRRQRQRAAVLAGAGTAPPVRRAVRSYGPLVVASAAFLVVAAAVAVPRDHVAYRGPVEVPGDVTTALVDESGAPVEGPVAAGPGGAAGVVTGANAGVRACPDRALQVPGDPYSPPCYAFSGDNGGATAKGVTDDTITITARSVEYGSATEIFASLAGQSLDDSPASEEETLVALAEYFSTRFQLYGRTLEVEYFRGEGNGINELLGGGKERALADAVRAAEEHGAFADITGITLPYSDALARNGVIAFGAPYPSRRWFEARRPYAWSLFSDGSNVAAASSSAVIGRYPPGSLAEHAGPSLRDQPRRFGIIAPENAEYQESVEVLIDRLRRAGIEVVTNQRYKLDLVSFPNQASGIIAQLKDAGVTSVLAYCDPAMLALGLTPKANEQGYEPEWITAGLVFVDQDVVAQTIDTNQWSRAFGTAYNAVSEPVGGSFPYFAYKSVRPDDEPAAGVEELYYQMYLLVLGLQMAGPNLTPETFEAGMFAYPGAFGPRGTWDFGPGDYTPTNDYREIWWDPDRISGQNRQPGTWVQLNEGRRWSPDDPPQGRAPFFEAG
jgi:hypothetical protein